MPAIKTGSFVLVSGANGFIASWICTLLLEQGFKVRGTVRSFEKGDFLSELFKKYKDNWSYVIVEDLTNPDGFDEAVRDIEGIIHVASPFATHASEDPYQTYISPAVNGTLSVLKSANGLNGKSVKRIVITSSLGAVASVKSLSEQSSIATQIFTDKDFNEEDPKIFEEKGSAAPPFTAYFASKVLAEKSAWEYVKTHKPKYDLTTICPSFVLGPIIHDVKDEKSLNASINFFYQFLLGRINSEIANRPTGSVVDVRDVAVAHIQSLLFEKAGGRRYIVSKQPLIWQDALDIVNESSEVIHWPDATKRTSYDEKLVIADCLDTSKSVEDLKLDYHPFDTTILDTCSSLNDLFENQ